MTQATVRAVEKAAVHHGALSKQGLLERAFARAFRGLVYAQIWEDPVVDMDALAITPDCHIVAIASGGCNVLSYLTAQPERITAVDLNTAHVALNNLKIAAALHLPDHAHFRRFFGDADHAANPRAYAKHVRPHLDAVSRRYWDGRDMAGRRRIGMFARGAYRHGLLGRFIGAAHLLARVHGVDPSVLLAANDAAERQQLFDERIAPLFERPAIRWLTDRPASLFGLGIPPAQYQVLAGDQSMASVLRARLHRLACGHELEDNYFAWQAFGRSYGKAVDAPLPPYLQGAHYETVRAGASRVDVVHASITDWLATQPAQSQDRYILLDAQDWMDDTQLNALWAQITRTAKPGARVLFRTAAEPSLLPGRVTDDMLARWDYCESESQDLTLRDRSSIYGGVHLYILRG